LLRLLRELGFDYLEDTEEDVLSTVRELAELRGLRLEDLRVPKVIVLSLCVGATNLLKTRFHAREAPWVYRARPLYVGRIDGIDVGIIWASPGAPLAAMIMEHLIACGARYFIGLGLLAAIQPSIEVGTIVVPIKALRGEGTSYYYLPEDEKAVPDTILLNIVREACRELGAECLEGAVYTTDAVHRETRKLVEALRSRNVLGFDMEASAIYAVAKYRKVRALNILVTSTNPRTKSIGFYSEKLNRSLNRAIDLIEYTIKRIHIQ